MRIDQIGAVSDDEMNRRIAVVAARSGIARGPMVVRRIPGMAKPDDREVARTAIVEALAGGREASVSWLAEQTGLTRPRAGAAVRELIEAGRVESAGRRRQALTGRRQYWRLAP